MKQSFEERKKRNKWRTELTRQEVHPESSGVPCDTTLLTRKGWKEEDGPAQKKEWPRATSHSSWFTALSPMKIEHKEVGKLHMSTV